MAPETRNIATVYQVLGAISYGTYGAYIYIYIYIYIAAYSISYI